MDRVVMAVDFGEASEKASRWLSRHFAPRSRIDLMHVLRPQRTRNLLSRALQLGEPPSESEIERAEEQLSELARSLDPRRPGSFLDVEGSVAELLVARGGRLEADLLAVPDPDAQESASRLPGSIAARVIRQADRPVLVARGTLAEPPRRILAALTDAAETQETWTWVRYLAELHRAELVLLHVENSWYANQLRQHLSERQGRQLQQEQRKRGRAFLEELASDGVDDVEVRIETRSGQTGPEILKAAEALDADLVVCGLRGRGPTRPLIGSVARFIVQKSRTSVLVVPQPVQPSMNRTDSDTISGVGEAPS